MTALKWITTEAKKLKKQYPKRFATWREYVAQASAIYASKHKGKTPVRKKHKIGAAGDYAKFEIATIKALAKSLRKSLKATQILVNNDQKILNIISNSFDQKMTPAQTVKVIKAELTPVAKADPLKAFVNILSKPGKHKANFPMKLPATVTIGSVKKKAAKKKAAAKSYHKDTHSHNVKISVMSGAKNTHYAINLNEYNKYKKLIEDTTKLLHDWEWRLKNEFSADEKKAYRHDIKIMKAELKEYKFLMNYHKKHIKAKL